jgi:uncharacterized repeat protein (TIGR01451 family)/uncharacterized delta-60 repeat protein
MSCLQSTAFVPARIGIAWLGISLLISFGISELRAQPANDNWANAQLLTGVWSSVTNDNTGATAEPGEPSHGGFVATNSIWYTWVAPQDGEVALDTLGSGSGLIEPAFDTVLAVYDGTNVATLRQVAANDDLYPFRQETVSAQVIPGIGPLPFIYNLPYNGPSALRFNVTAGHTYYIAADTKDGNTGPIVVNLAYHPTGVFRWATEDFMLDPFGGGLLGPMFQCAELDAIPDNDTVFQSYYRYKPGGVLVTVTRIAGSTGRMLVDYATQDGTALAGVDYTNAAGTLIFDDFEMSKTLVIGIIPQIAVLDRDFTIQLSNPRLDPGESPEDLPAPRVQPEFATAIVHILATGVPADDPDAYPDPTSGNPPTHDVFNFGQSHYIVPEDINDYYTTVEVDVFRTFPQAANGDGASLHYRINNFVQDNTGADEEFNNLFPLTAGADYATPNPPNANTAIRGTNSDFTIAEGTISFGANEGFRPIFFTVTNDTLTEFNEDFKIQIYRDITGGIAAPGELSEATVTILFDDRDPPAGSVDEFHNADFGVDMSPAVATTPPQMTNPGADGVVYSLISQNDGRTVIAGNFFTYDTIPRRCIARMNTDGSIDTSFNPGGGADDFISSLALTSTGKFMIGGGFLSYNSTARNRVARLNANGSLDGTFNPGQGADGTVWSVVVQPDDRALIGGEFSFYNVTGRQRIARLNTDGSLDPTFDMGTNGPNGTVWVMALQPDGKILIGGEFTAVGAVSRNGIARLNADGSLDLTFDPGTGVLGIVYTLALRPDGKIWIGGEFNFVNSVPRKRFARLNANGSLDQSFDPGGGANDTVYSIAVQTNGNAYVGGVFTSFNGTHRMGFTRLYDDGTVDTTFLDSAYNQFAGLHRGRFSDPAGVVFTSSVQPDGNVLIGGSFQQVGGGQASAKVRFDQNYPTNIYNVDVWTEKKARDGLRNRSNIARLLGGETGGPGNISLMFNSYPIGENQSVMYAALMRTNGTLGYLSANFSVQAGQAQSGIDYIYNGLAPIYLSSWRAYFLDLLSSIPASQTRMHSDGLFNTNAVPQDIYGNYWFNYNQAQALVSIVNDNIVQGDRSASVQLDNPSGADQFYLGGENIPLGGALGLAKAPFTITDDDHHSGVIGFGSANFSVNENGTNATITVVRTNGSFGSVSVQYATANGSALSGTDYQSRSGSLSFGSGQTNKTFTIPIINNSVVQPIDRTVNLRLTAPGGGASLGLSNAVLSIVDDDYQPGFVNFSAANYTTNESSGAVILTVNRSGGSRGTLTVQVGTTNGTALAGVDYVATTNTLQWNDLDSSPRYVTVTLIHDGQVGSNNTFQAVLFNPKVNTTNAPTVLAGATSKTTVTIVDDDAYGNLQFSAPSYLTSENGGIATITVTRTAGAAGTLSVQFATADGGAVSSGPLPNFVATNGTLTFNPGEVSKSFNVTLIDDGVIDPPQAGFFFTVNLSGLSPSGAVFGSPISSQVYIVDAEGYNQPSGSPDTAFTPSPGMDGDVFSIALQSDGKIVAVGDFSKVNLFARSRLARVNSDASLDTTFLSGLSGANAAVRAMKLQSNGRILIGGAFTRVNGVNRPHFARLLGDGSLDSSFNPGSGSDDSVFAVAETFVGVDRRLLIGGGFTTVSGSSRPGLTRLNDDGTIDGSFNPALSINGTVYAIAVYPTNGIQSGKILIGGDFSQINGVNVGRVARLTSDGTLDPTFNPGSGADDIVRALAIQVDGRVLVGGAFTHVNGTALTRVARLNVDGSVDVGFNPGAGADDTVLTFLLQPDNRILVGGQFTHFSGVSRGRITRLMADGSVDPSINFGAGADSFVNSLALQPDNQILLGGGFTQFDGQPSQRIARIYGGSISGSGGLEFAASDFQVDEKATNAVISIRRRGGTIGTLIVNFATSNGTAIAGINYSNVTATLTFPVGETLRTVIVPVRDDFQITPDLTANLALSGAPLANQPTATLTILNDDSAFSFSAVAYSRPENASDGEATIHILRQGSTRGAAAVEFMTTTNGTAGINTNYLPVDTLVTFQPGDTNLTVQVPVLRDPRAQGDTTVQLILTNAVNALVIAPSVATLTILDVDHAPGQLMFAQTTNIVSEGAGFLPVTIVRTNGRLGVVSVNFATLPGTALPGLKYVATNGVLTFGDNETNKTFTVPILNEAQVEGNQTFSIVLSNATGGASLLLPTNVLVTILDDDVGVSFASPVYVAAENGSGSVALTVLRPNGTNATTTVNYATTNGTAIAGTNYIGTSGTLSFAPGETIKSFSIGILDDPRVTGDLNFNVNLFNPSAPAQLQAPSTASVVVLDSDAGFAFTNANFFGVKSGTNVLITVLRTNANTGIVSVNYATSNGTAQAGVDYVPAAGLLTFSNGVALQTFSVTIISNRLVQGDRAFTVSLLNPSPGTQLIPPSIASVTITDNISGLSFSSPAYTIAENGGHATISVFRSNFTNSLVTVDYSTADGTGHAGENYLPVNGTLVFTNGDTVKTFDVPVKDNSVIDGDKTVLLHLTNATGNAILLNPNAAILNMIETDGSLIVPAGTSLLSESGPVNGTIDPGENVSLLFGLRNTSGTNTASLVATLLATNGVANPSAPQNYGALTVRGPSASRPYSFTALGTNGQNVKATFQLQDGTHDLGFATFNFSIGKTSNSYSNNALITIRDNTNALPYPSPIAVDGVGGVVSKLVITLTNFTHSSPSDVDILLVSPDSKASLIMAKAGTNTAGSRVTLTFDDSAANFLPQFNQIVSGTYRPTSYAAAPPPFPVPAPPGPYGTTLSYFNGSNPNGNWSLYVFDDTFLDAGIISNGWIMNLTASFPIAGDGDVGVVMNGSQANVVATSNLTYTVGVTNYGPAAASGVVLTDILPVGANYLGSSASTGTLSTNGAGLLIWTIGAMNKDANASLTINVRPLTAGLITNSITVVSSSSDPNPDDNSASVVTTVLSPTADIALGMLGPSPVLLGDNLTYTLIVTNFGPATATTVAVTNTLPSGVNFISAAPAGYRLVGSQVTFTNLGNLASGAQTTATITVKPLVAGTLTNNATSGSGILDPLKGNNSASVKTLVEALPLRASYSAGTLSITWPVNAGNYVLESATNLVSPIVWTVVTNPAPTIVNGQYSVNLPVGTGSRYFRLRAQIQ